MTATTSTGSGVLDAVGDRLARARHAGSTWIVAHRPALLWLVPLMAVSSVVSFLNIAGAPQRIDDEGTYTAQAWAVNNLGELAHYTYWYDHPPLGWLQIAGYTGLTGAFARWDIAVLAGREAVIVASLVSVVLIWMLSRRLGLRRPAAAVAGLVFAISPLALSFHRTVYLDNVATPWLLLAFLLALSRRWQLVGFAGSAVAFGVAVLSKETFLLALPVLIWVIVRNASPETRRYTLSVAASILVLIGGSYLLLAVVKGELVPGPERVSLFDGIGFQLSGRAGSGSAFDPESLIARTLTMWWDLDPVIIVLGIIAAGLALPVRALRPFGVLVLALVAFMFRPGGYLPVPYVIMLLPFAAILIAGVADTAVHVLQRRNRRWRPLAIATVAITALAVVAAVPLWAVQLRGFVLADIDRPMRQAQTWVADNVTRDARLIVDDAMWVDLVRAGWDRENVVWYYKVDTDPGVQAQNPQGWRDADYVITTGSMRTFPDGFPQVQQAIDNSIVVATFGQSEQAVEVRRVLPQGIEQATADSDAAFEERVSLGEQLVRNPALTLSTAARDDLIDGEVDARIILALGAQAADSDLEVTSFPVLAGEQGVRRTVEFDSIDGEPAAVGGRASAAAESFAASLDRSPDGDSAPNAGVVDGRLRFTLPLDPTTVTVR